MPFIGIFAKENDSNFIKNEILKNSKKTKFEIININKKNIINMKNIKFEAIVINENISELLESSKYFEYILKQTNYIIINSDVKNNISLLKDANINIITYGLNGKATITMSSINDDNILLCQQRNIININGDIIEMQENNIKVNKNNIKKSYNVLIMYAILSIFGENLATVK